MKLTNIFTATLIAASIPFASIAQSAPAQIDVSDFPATMVDDVVVPVPSEIFSVLDKLGTPDWRDQLRENPVGKLGDGTQIALLLGTVVAEGFIAVQARDSERVKEIGREVLRLSDAMGVRQAVIAHCNSIIEGADAKDWRRVRSELDKAQQNVRQAMLELRDGERAQLVSLGGWLRGTEVLTAIVMANYTEDGAELLHQPMLVEYFINQLDSMSPKIVRNPIVPSISTVLKEILPLVKNEGAVIKDDVIKINGLVTGIVKSIVDPGN